MFFFFFLHFSDFTVCWLSRVQPMSLYGRWFWVEFYCIHTKHSCLSHADYFSCTSKDNPTWEKLRNCGPFDRHCALLCLNCSKDLKKSKQDKDNCSGAEQNAEAKNTTFFSNTSVPVHAANLRVKCHAECFVIPVSSLHIRHNWFLHTPEICFSDV